MDNADERAFGWDVHCRSGCGEVSQGVYHTCALDDNGVACWGYNLYGQT